MSSLPPRAEPSPPRRRQPAGPTQCKCRLTLTVNGTPYNVRPVPADSFGARFAFRLKKLDGTIYDVVATIHGHECDCADFVFARDGVDPAGCKHIKALVACGLLSGKGGSQ
jgi:hypothetical protein